MKKSIKFTLIGLVALAIIAGSIYYMMMPIPVRMTEIQPQVAELSFTEQGVVTAENTVLVFPIVHGELSSLYVREGQQVRAGDALLSIDDTSLQLQLAQVESGIRGLEAQLANLDVEQNRIRQDLQSTRNALQGELQAINAQAADTQRAISNQNEVVAEQTRLQNILIEQSQNDANLARENFTRVQYLHNSGVATRSEFEAAETNLSRAEAALEASQHELAIISTGNMRDNSDYFAGVRASINARIAGINQQLNQDFTTQTAAQLDAMIDIERANAAQIERQLQNTIISAPTDGIVTILHAQGANVVSAAQPVAEITVPGGMYVDVYVSTQDTSTIQVGDTVRMTLRQRTDDIEFEGRIVEIGSTAVVRLSALGIEERKVSVTIQPHLPADLNLGIGYAVDVSFYVYREENQLLVPRTALFRDNGQYMVWRVQNGEAQAIPVETGTNLRTETVILSGLVPGDFVVNDANNQDLRDGARLTNE